MFSLVAQISCVCFMAFMSMYIIIIIIISTLTDVGSEGQIKKKKHPSAGWYVVGGTQVFRHCLVCLHFNQVMSCRFRLRPPSPGPCMIVLHRLLYRVTVAQRCHLPTLSCHEEIFLSTHKTFDLATYISHCFRDSSKRCGWAFLGLCSWTSGSFFSSLN